MTNIEWIAAGNTGCTFATMFARAPEKVGWINITHEKYDSGIFPNFTNSLIVSTNFPEDWTAKKVREWCKTHRAIFQEEEYEDAIGLRYRLSSVLEQSGAKDSWVQYFGPDSHVPTRRTPTPMIMYTRKLNPLGYYKQVGFSGILHLAHAFSKHLTDKMVDTLWHRSYEQTKKRVGHELTRHEAAKVTWLKKDLI